MPIGALGNYGALGNVRRLASRTTFTIGLVLKNSGGIIQRELDFQGNTVCTEAK